MHVRSWTVKKVTFNFPSFSGYRLRKVIAISNELARANNPVYSKNCDPSKSRVTNTYVFMQFKHAGNILNGNELDNIVLPVA